MMENRFRLNYPFWDKALHYLAFHTTGLQRKLAEFETQEYLEKIETLSVKKPVFILGLPRSGTTLLLNLLSKSSEFCYQTYADMPFVLTPLLWSRFRKKFGKQAIIQQRSHGDGINISLEAPEAFEEMLFKAWYPQRYSEDVLAEGDEIYSEQFICFFKKHIAKLMLRDNKQRYLSKNNANIGRLRFLRQSFPDARLIAVYRSPLDQATSLLKQHTNFTDLHSLNTFTARYMAATGHFDFGINLKPINFNRWAEQTSYRADEINYWLAYWIASYQHLLKSNIEVKFVCYESLCESPTKHLTDIAHYTGISHNALLEHVKLIRGSGVLISGTGPKADIGLLKQAEEVYLKLRQM